jgi:uncharacterized protein YdhG (YjbR/CyaY superfamily)
MKDRMMKPTAKNDGPASATSATIDGYIAGYPPDVQAILQRVRETIAKAAPDAVETIAYRMPSFVLDGPLVYFGGFKEHVGFYPPVGDPALQRAAAAYANERGNLRFPYSEPIPYALITKLVKARVAANRAKASAKRVKKAAKR